MRHPWSRALLAAAMLVLISSAASAAVVYVKWDSPGPTFDGASWETAFHKVQDGLNASTSGNEVWVAKGTYIECITLKDGVGLYGGFLGTETIRDQRDFRINETILDGGLKGSTVIAPAGAGRAAIIDGFTVRRSADRGIRCENSSPTIRNNTIRENNLNFLGGGVFCSRSSALIADNTITGNYADYGGGIYCDGSSPTITGNTITGNHATDYGGGILCTTSSPLIADNVIRDNLSSQGGGGVACFVSSPAILHNTLAGDMGMEGGAVYCFHSSPTIGQNTISGNDSDRGGGVYCEASSPAIVNNTFSYDGGDLGGGLYCTSHSSPLVVGNLFTHSEVYCTDASSPTLVNDTIVNCSTGICCIASSPTVINTIITLNSYGVKCDTGADPVFRTCDVYGNSRCDFLGIDSPIGTNGNISANPLFVSTPTHNYHITAASPCVGAGSNDAPGLTGLDMDGEGRIFGHGVDIGADEYWSPTASISDIKYAGEGAKASLTDAIVTAGCDGYFYIEAENRSMGIRVVKPAHGLKAGAKVNVIGTIKTNADGERFIEASSVTQTGGGSIKPLHITSGALGGGDWLYSASTGAGQQGVVGGVGLNNIGMLVTTWGRISYLNGTYGIDDTKLFPGDKDVTEGFRSICKDTYARVTGAVSCYRDVDGLHAVIIVTEVKPL